MTTGAAIVGSGFMGWVHTEALRRAGVPIVGVLGSSPQKSQAAAQQLGLNRSWGSYDELLADGDVGCVHIVTPNRFHFDMCRRALAAGRHVLCEKPLAMNAAESAELVRLAAEHPDLRTGVNYNVRFYPLCHEARSRVRSGEAGDIFHVSGSYLQDWLLYQTDYNWRVLAEEGGDLRAVADIGTHWLDLVQFITGLGITSVCADLRTVHPRRQRPVGEVATFQQDDTAEREEIEVTTEDFGAVLLEFESGARGSVVVSQVTAGRKNCLQFEIAGSRLSLAWNSEQANELRVGHRDRANEFLIRDPSLLSAEAQRTADYPGGHNEGYADSFKQCFRAFYRDIEQGAAANPAYPTFADGHREIVLCEAIRQSHLERKWVDVPTQD